jgi:hypothetical protein
LDDHVTKRGTLNNIRPNITSHLYFSTDRMGRFSRGIDNYNMHFQGVIHLGMTLFGMCSFRNLSHISGVVLTYAGRCCEEKLDFLIQNENTPPSVPVISHNPLLFAKTSLTACSQHIKRNAVTVYTHTVDSVHAVAYLVLGRILAATSVIILGPAERITPVVRLISVAEVLGVGLQPILSALADYLFLLLPYMRDEQDNVLQNIPPSSFMELAMICLLPEVIPQFPEFIGENFIVSLFTQPRNVCQLLKQLVVNEVYTIIRSTHWKMKTTALVYFTSARIGTSRILHVGQTGMGGNWRGG